MTSPVPLDLDALKKLDEDWQSARSIPNCDRTYNALAAMLVGHCPALLDRIAALRRENEELRKRSAATGYSLTCTCDCDEEGGPLVGGHDPHCPIHGKQPDVTVTIAAAPPAGEAKPCPTCPQCGKSAQLVIECANCEEQFYRAGQLDKLNKPLRTVFEELEIRAEDAEEEVARLRQRLEEAERAKPTPDEMRALGRILALAAGPVKPTDRGTADIVFARIRDWSLLTVPEPGGADG